MRLSSRLAPGLHEVIRSARQPFADHRPGRVLENVAAFRPVALVIGLVCAVSGCSRSPESPVAPSPGTSAGPRITSVSPSLGSAAGGAIVTITGTGFMTGTTVTFDNITVSARHFPRSSSTTFYAEAPAHHVGPVDLIVTNPDGKSQRVAAAYTYGLEDAFDMNGIWLGFTDNGTDTGVEFEIRNDILIRAVCAYDAVVPFVFSNSPRVQNGGFSLIAEDGATLPGKIVSESEMVGTINFPACNETPSPWRVSRKRE